MEQRDYSIPGQVSTEEDEVEVIFHRNPQGLTLKAKGAVIEKFARSLIKGGRVDATVQSGLGVAIHNAPLPIDNPTVLWDPGRKFLYSEGILNITFLSAVGLETGVELKIPGLYSNATLESIRRHTINYIQDLAKNYLRPITLGTVIKWERRWDG